MSDDRIELQADLDIELVPTDGNTKLRIRVPADTFARIATLLDPTGPNWIGFDFEQAYEEESLGEAVGLALASVRQVVSLPGHLAVNLVNDDTQIQLSLPQPVRTTDSVRFKAARMYSLGSMPEALTLTAGPGAGPDAVVPTTLKMVNGSRMMFKVQCTVAGTPTGSSLPLAVCQIDFPEPFDVVPMVMVIPANRAAWQAQSAAATAVQVPDGAITTSGFTLQSGTSTNLSAGQTYAWWFIVVDCKFI